MHENVSWEHQNRVKDWNGNHGDLWGRLMRVALSQISVTLGVTKCFFAPSSVSVATHLAQGSWCMGRCGGGAELAGSRMTGEVRIVWSPCIFTTQQMRKWFFLANGAPDGKCNNLISALKRVLNLMQRNKLGVKGLKNAVRTDLGSLEVVHCGGPCKSVRHHGCAKLFRRVSATKFTHALVWLKEKRS